MEILKISFGQSFKNAGTGTFFNPKECSKNMFRKRLMLSAQIIPMKNL